MRKSLVYGLVLTLVIVDFKYDYYSSVSTGVKPSKTVLCARVTAGRKEKHNQCWPENSQNTVLGRPSASGFSRPRPGVLPQTRQVVPVLPGAETKKLFLQDGKGRRHVFMVTITTHQI
jgi:hypothetical protein